MSLSKNPNTHHSPIIRDWRSAYSEDLDAILAVARQSPEASSWSRESYARSATDPTALILVAESSGTISGFLLARLVADQAEILNLAVNPCSRRQGHASALLKAALERLHSRGATSVYLEVRQSNTVAVAFYHSHGFSLAGIRKAYYQNPSEDALNMQKKLTAHSG